ncbi:MAG: hypothetical protein DI609_00285 [Corynebacterium urealyticum]|uniref:Abi family protein n=1 Tax=Corynebacterium urealyticum TaxID=43771 RepID=A0A2W5BDF3_9CORY|nr:hypothetical protein [Corynebacterium sp. MSK039]MDK8790889.1 hypothetical protein [Corynebacterium sp. MSK039]PZP03893.1 MAG: hypothetical protein DI609_00285 [Corynebacterium urealyticum]
MTSQEALQLLLSEKRLAPFAHAASGNIARAEELYRWNNRLSGALHAQIGLFEVITRNALDRALRAWCLQRFGTSSWTSRDLPANEIHVLISRQLADARKNTAKAARNRPPRHPRKNAKPIHDDVVAQLTLGNWAALLGAFPRHQMSPKKQEAAASLWSNAHTVAFPRLRLAPQQDGHSIPQDGISLGDNYRRVTDLRNRVAHHENLLDVRVNRRLNDMITVLAAIDENIPGWFLRGSKVRRIYQQDPRGSWS